ncbi:MAG: UDP-2,4-diacetamido-2,4,6-trideoxy-beta-L-altropyranose hydrolase, partial [Proteobacteria bacterium]
PWSIDLKQSIEAAGNKAFDWVIIDHYGIDFRWEQGMRPFTKNVMVIDDLANRKHDCDLLLDQTLGREEVEYSGLTNESTRILVGSRFALLRPEFSELRDFSLKRRAEFKMENILVSLGGIDSGNSTQRVLETIEQMEVPEGVLISVVLGEKSPHIHSIKNFSTTTKLRLKIEVGSKEMARLMSGADCAIGAAGATSWERCCLGVPSIILVLAENQENIANQLGNVGAVLVSNDLIELKIQLEALLRSTNLLRDMSAKSSLVTDGLGCLYAVDVLVEVSRENFNTM